MKRPYRLFDMLSNSNKFSITINHNGETINFLTGSATTKFLEENFGDFLYLAKYDPEKTKAENINNAKSRFSDIFEQWKNDNSRNFEFLYSAMYDEYNPLENYDRKEDGSYTDEHHKGNKTATSYKEVTTPNLTTEITNRTKVKSSDFVFGFDSATASPSGYTESVPTEGTDKTLQTGNTEITRNVEENYTSISDISGTVFDNDKRTFDNYHIHGNIGVLTSSDALLKEYELRKQNFVSEIIKDFIVKYTMYIDC